MNTIRKLLTNWYLPLVMGILSILFALIIFSNPALSISFLMFGFGIAVLFFGIRECRKILKNRKRTNYFLIQISTSVFVVIGGIILIFNPLLSFAYLNTFIAILLMIKAISNILLQSKSDRIGKQAGSFQWPYSILLILVSLFIWNRPQLLSGLMVTLSGIPFLILGFVCIAISFALRNTNHKLQSFKQFFKDRTKDAEFEIVED